MDRPDAADIREWAPRQFDFASFGYPAPAGPDPDPLESEVEAADAIIALTIARTWSSITDPDEMAVAKRAAVLWTMYAVAGTSSAAITAIFGAPWLKSFTAGSYSETRFSPAEVTTKTSIHPLPALADLLWLLMTPERREEWLERLTGVPAAAGGMFEHDWNAGDELRQGYGSSHGHANGPLWPA